MRIVSLLPAATEWLAAFAATDLLIGRSHACDHPAEVDALPVVTRLALNGVDPGAPEADAAAIEASVQQQVGQGLHVFEVDVEGVRALRPSLIVTQPACDVCAVPLVQLEAVLAAAGGWDPVPEVFAFTPATFKQVLDAALRLARRVGQMGAAMQAIGAAEAGLQRLQTGLGLQRAADPSARPSVVCLEWLAPLMTAGHWGPDLITLAGGRPLLAEQGTRSRVVEWAAVRAADPDVLVLACCGFTVAQTQANLHHLTRQRGWADLRAVRAGQVYLMDGGAYFNRPGPRLYRAVALLAWALYPEADVHPPVSPWEALRLEG